MVVDSTELTALRVHLFGAGDVTRGSSPVGISSSALALFSYLLLQRECTASRPALIEILAPDQPPAAARHRLNTAVWRLRRSLEPDGIRGESIVSSDRRWLRINLKHDVWVDTIEFERSCAPVRLPAPQWTAQDADLVQSAIDMYAGELLTGVADDWVARERERLAQMHRAALGALAQWHRRAGNSERAIRLAEEAVAADPLAEAGHRLVMVLYAEAGLRERAIRQFERCREVLAGELGIAPSTETTALLARLMREADEDADFGDLVATLRSTRAELMRLRDLIDTAIGHLDKP